LLIKVLSRLGILITVTGLAMSLLHLKGDGMVTGIGVILYTLVTFREYQTTNSSCSGHIVDRVLIFSGLMVLLISAFFKIMSWPYASILLSFGVLLVAVRQLFPVGRSISRN
jgi:hypothetical protein